ncbi:SixA phosphatase family protein [Hoeflea marina]|nr:histidine phosphatase family protein [Hoeflea marina]
MRIFLVRHAHAGWPASGARDFDRPLDERGREEASRLAAAMVVNGFAPEVILCSGASRCTQTLAVLLHSALATPRLVTNDMMYSGSVQTYLDLIAAEAAAGSASVMLVGHNPMIEETARALLQSSPDALDKALGNGFPTAGLLIADTAPGGDLRKCRFVGLLSPVDA